MISVSPEKGHHEGEMWSDIKRYREGDVCHYVPHLIIACPSSQQSTDSFLIPPFPRATHTPTHCMGHNNARLILSSVIITQSFSTDIRIRELWKKKERQRR